LVLVLLISGSLVVVAEVIMMLLPQRQVDLDPQEVVHMLAQEMD
jgi:hypothetical protein